MNGLFLLQFVVSILTSPSLLKFKYEHVLNGLYSILSNEYLVIKLSLRFVPSIHFQTESNNKNI